MRRTPQGPVRRRLAIIAALAAASAVLAPAAASAQRASDTAAHNVLTAAERAAGWRLLFDGRSLAGWRGLGRDTVPSAYWTVRDGAIEKRASGQVPHAPDGQPLVGGDLLTDSTYGDFELSWQWKISPGGNSGIKYNVSEALSITLEPHYAAKGFEYQLLDDDRHADGKLPTHRAAALYDLIAPNATKRLRRVGEWNTSRIVFRGRHGEHWLNGAEVVEYELGSPAMVAALAASKYRVIPWFAVRRRGPVVLQDHDDAVWFRDLKIRELPAAAP